MDKDNIRLDGVVHQQKEGNAFQVISNDANTTLNQLKKAGAEQLQETRMMIDEIAVHILKEGKNVAAR